MSKYLVVAVPGSAPFYVLNPTILADLIQKSLDAHPKEKVVSINTVASFVPGEGIQQGAIITYKTPR